MGKKLEVGLIKKFGYGGLSYLFILEKSPLAQNGLGISWLDAREYIEVVDSDS